jgi:uncharacterized protein YciI
MWFICLRKAVQPRDHWTATVDEHLAWMRQQHEAGGILFSGPGALPNGERVGIYLIRCASRAEAERIAASDPFTAAGHCSFDLIEWEVHQVLGAGPFSAAGLRG